MSVHVEYDPELFVVELLDGGVTDETVTGPVTASTTTALNTSLTLVGSYAGCPVLIPGIPGVRYSEVRSVLNNSINQVNVTYPWTVPPIPGTDTFYLVRPTDSGIWTALDVSRFTYGGQYTPDENATLIIDMERASLSMSYWGIPADPPLYSGDVVRAKYDDEVLGVWVVDTTAFEYVADPQAQKYGENIRTTFTATLAGKYAAALGRTVSWDSWPEESPLERISHTAEVQATEVFG